MPSCSRHSPNIEWVGSSKGALKKFPATVQDQVGFALYQAQAGLKHRDVKPLKGLGAPVLARIDHRFGNEGDFGRPERFSESFSIDPVQVE